tara:strand:- start:33679 stop:34020 length:342 start_codon:yes stop_codon:yes gene_type:complete
VLALLGAVLTAVGVILKGGHFVEDKAASPRLDRLSRGSFTASSSSDLVKDKRSMERKQTQKVKDTDPGPLEKQLLKAAKGAAQLDAFLSGIEFAGISVVLAGAGIFFINWYVS